MHQESSGGVSKVGGWIVGKTIEEALQVGPGRQTKEVPQGSNVNSISPERRVKGSGGQFAETMLTWNKRCQQNTTRP